MLRFPLVLLLPTALFAGDPPAETFLILKTGEAGATPEMAGPFLAEWATWLSPRLGAQPEGVITSDPATAVELARERRPAWGIVTPAFFLEHEKDLGLRPLLETRRRGHATEKYAVVVRKGATWDGSASPAATTLAKEGDYLAKVVFAGKVITLQESKNLADDLCAMVEGDADAPRAVLLDRAATDFFREDDLTWPKLDVAWESEELPPDLVVGFGEALSQEAETKLRDALGGMLADAEGKKVCRSLQTEGFGEVDAARLERVREAYGKQPH